MKTLTILSKRTLSSVSNLAYTPVTPNLNKAYDECLRFLERYKADKLDEAKSLKAKIQAEQDEKKKECLNKLRIQSLIQAYQNHPETLWNFEQGQYDIEEPVYLYLKQQQLYKIKYPILEQRVKQHYLIPDIIPPSAKLEINIDLKINSVPIECGQLRNPVTTLNKPEIRFDVFHKETKHYLLAMIDLDYPNEKLKRYDCKTLWMIKNIPLSLTQNVLTGTTVVEYIPPHPNKGNNTQRYVIALYEQPAPDIELKNTKEDIRKITNDNNMKCKGITFFISKWDDVVSQIYKEILKEDEPVYGDHPIIDPRIGPDGKSLNRYRNA